MKEKYHIIFYELLFIGKSKAISLKADERV